ncbi:hypothetical protein LXL04_021408 [Taraxacum kok-saghyz]
MTDMAYMTRRPYSSTLGSLAHATVSMVFYGEDLEISNTGWRLWKYAFQIQQFVCTPGTITCKLFWLKPKTFPPCSSLFFCNLSPNLCNTLKYSELVLGFHRPWFFPIWVFHIYTVKTNFPAIFMNFSTKREVPDEHMTDLNLYSSTAVVISGNKSFVYVQIWTRTANKNVDRFSISPIMLLLASAVLDAAAEDMIDVSFLASPSDPGGGGGRGGPPGGGGGGGAPGGGGGGGGPPPGTGLAVVVLAGAAPVRLGGGRGVLGGLFSISANCILLTAGVVDFPSVDWSPEASITTLSFT